MKKQALLIIIICLVVAQFFSILWITSLKTRIITLDDENLSVVKNIEDINLQHSQLQRKYEYMKDEDKKKKDIIKTLEQDIETLQQEKGKMYDLTVNQLIMDTRLEPDLISIVNTYFTSLAQGDEDKHKSVIENSQHMLDLYNRKKNKEYTIKCISYDNGDPLKIPQKSTGFFIVVELENKKYAFLGVYKNEGRWRIYDWD